MGTCRMLGHLLKMWGCQISQIHTLSLEIEFTWQIHAFLVVSAFHWPFLYPLLSFTLHWLRSWIASQFLNEQSPILPSPTDCHRAAGRIPDCMLDRFSELGNTRKIKAFGRSGLPLKATGIRKRHNIVQFRENSSLLSFWKSNQKENP